MLDSILNQIAENKIEEAIQSLRTVFTLAESELVNDVIVIGAQHSKLKSDQRRGIISYEDGELTRNKILNALLELVEEIKNNPDTFRAYAELESGYDDAVQIREALRVQYGVDASLDSISQKKKQHLLPREEKEILIGRMAHVKRKNAPVKALWIDDFPENNGYEKSILTSLGIQVDLAKNSAEALILLKAQNYHLVISDIWREDKKAEGIRFMHQVLDDENLDLPFIFYISFFDPTKGVPPGAFGIADLPADFFHLVLDVVERRF